MAKSISHAAQSFMRNQQAELNDGASSIRVPTRSPSVKSELREWQDKACQNAGLLCALRVAIKYLDKCSGDGPDKDEFDLWMQKDPDLRWSMQQIMNWLYPQTRIPQP